MKNFLRSLKYFRPYRGRIAIAVGCVLIIASLAMLPAYLPWYNYSAVLPLVRREFSLTSSDAGLILALRRMPESRAMGSGKK